MFHNYTNARTCAGKLLLILGLAVLPGLPADCLAADRLAADDKRPDKAPEIDAQALARLVQSFEKVEKEEFSWGWIRWLMNSKLDPKAAMTFGIVHVNAGQTNPLHVHPNCEEQLYVLSGSCEHRIGKQTVVLKAGDVIRIPRGVSHMARTFDKEPMRAVIVYDTGERQFEVVEQQDPPSPGREGSNE